MNRAALLLLLLASSICFADVAPNKTDIPDVDVWEAQRRGNLVQEIGTTRADAVDRISAALATPPDDSHKWYLTVVTTRGCRACEKLKYDFLHAPQLRAWVNVEEPAKSAMHYHVRRIEDPTQRDWFKGIERQLRKGGFPAIVIQPPRSGEFGRSATTVAILHGYDGDAEALTERLRRAIVTYVREYTAQHRQGGIRGNADAEEEAGEEASAAPPFAVPDRPLDPLQPNGPIDWPAIINPRPLTAAQIKQLVPDAPPEFCLQALQSGATDPQQVLQQWYVYQLQNQPQESPQQAAAGAGPSWWQIIGTLLNGGSFATILSLVVMIVRKFGNDKELRDLLQQLFEQFGASSQGK